MTSSAAQRSAGAAAFAIGVTALFALTFVIGSTADEEEFRFAVLSAWLHVDALRHGSLGLWTPLLGLGLPQPFVPNFRLHPLLPLLAVVSPVTWARAILVGHTLLGALGMWRLTRFLSLTGIVRATCVATFLLCTPAQNYSVTDFWPSHYLVWTSAPWLVLMVWQLFQAEGRRELAFYSVALGLWAGLVAANTNPGHLLVYTVFVGAMLAARWRAAAARWSWLLFAGGIAAVIASPGIVMIAHERPLFSADIRLGLGDQGLPLPPVAALNAFVSPFGVDTSDQWPFTRTLFFGGPFAVLALAGAFRFARRHADLCIVLVAGTVLLFTTFVPLPFVSARFQFRDPVTLAAILLAGCALNAFAAGPRRKPLIAGIVLLQLGVLIGAAWPALSESWGEDARRAEWFRGATGDVDAIDSLVRLAQPPGRMLLAPALDDEVFDLRRIKEGLGLNAFAYRRMPVVNGWFKGPSTGVVWPDERLFYGRIASSQPLVESLANLNLLGIHWVLSSEGTVATGLRNAGEVTLSNGAELTLYENPTAWPDAFLTNVDATELTPSIYAGCGNDRLLCTDLAPLADRRLADAVAVTARESGFDVRLLPALSERLLVVSQMYRPDWVATSNGNTLETVPVLRALLGVRIPAGTGSVEIRYRATAQMLSLIAAWVTIAAAAVSLVMLRPRRALPDNRVA